LLSIHKGDITRLELDGIVNAANSQLIVGGGVDRAIHNAAGPNLKHELEKITGYLPIGDAIITSGCDLPAKHVIHTVAPYWSGGSKGELAQLALCYENTMNLALDYELTSIAFPAIGTGAFGIPTDLAARIAIQTVSSFDVESLGIDVVFCVFSDEDHEIYAEVLEETKSQPTTPRALDGQVFCPVCFWPAYAYFLPRDETQSTAGSVAWESNPSSKEPSWKCNNCDWDGMDGLSRERENDLIQFLCLDSESRVLVSVKYWLNNPVPRSPIVGFGGAELPIDSPVIHGFFSPANHKRLGEMWIAFSTPLVESAMSKILSHTSALNPAALEFLGFRQVRRKPIFRMWI